MTDVTPLTLLAVPLKVPIALIAVTDVIVIVKGAVLTPATDEKSTPESVV